MAERFFLTESIVDGQTKLGDDQAHHLSRVMRAKPGDLVTLFDGCGTEHAATVEEVSKRNVLLSIQSSFYHSDPNEPEIIVTAALPKGDRQKYLIEKLVELGANRFIPLSTTRSVAEANEKVIARLQKQVIEASKQCRRSWLMQIDSQSSIEQVKSKFADFDGQKLLADPYAPPASQTQPNCRSVVAIGPEGGFTDEENDAFAGDDWTPICFSPNVLRIETAAAASVAILRAMSGNG